MAKVIYAFYVVNFMEAQYCNWFNAKYYEENKMMSTEEKLRNKREWSKKNYRESDHIKLYQKKYRQVHADKGKEYAKNYRQKNIVKLRIKAKEKYYRDIDKNRIYQRERAAEYRNRNRDTLAKRRAENREEYRLYAKRDRVVARAKVFELLGGARCVECGCSDERILEFNHINCDGWTWRKTHRNERSGIGFYRAVLTGKIDKNSLNVLCRVCNQVHFVEFKYGVRFIVQNVQVTS